MSIQGIAKCIDQPRVILNINKQMPKVLFGVLGAYGAIDTFKKPKDKRKKTALKNAIILGAAGGASLVCANGLSVAGRKLIKGTFPVDEFRATIKNQSNVIDEFLNNQKIDNPKVVKALENAKNKIVPPKDIDLLIKELPNNKAKSKLFKNLFGESGNVTSKDILHEGINLSLLGLVPVVGGVAGGIVADKVTGESSKQKNEDKVKEGIFQYLANIFLCNVGACAALFGLESLHKANIVKNVTPLKKLGVIMAGITATGIIGGSYVANFVCKNIVNPLFDRGKKNASNNVCEKRKVEPADMAMHVDDIATAGVLSGFRWVEPALPVLYSVSGYRAGIGYRNGGGHGHHHHKHSNKMNCSHHNFTSAVNIENVRNVKNFEPAVFNTFKY